MFFAGFPGVGEVLSWVAVGLVVGGLAGALLKGGGHGRGGQILIGMLGAVVGGALVGLSVGGRDGWVGSVLVAFLTSCIAVTLARATRPGKPRVRP